MCVCVCVCVCVGVCVCVCVCVCDLDEAAALLLKCSTQKICFCWLIKLFVCVRSQLLMREIKFKQDYGQGISEKKRKGKR